MESPRYEPHARFAALRGLRGFPATLAGLWCAGSLQGLERPCVAIVGTRAATAYGRRLAHDFAHDLGARGCAILSGLALGIDACAHEGALAAGAPTIAVLGGGHRCFFPPRNEPLAERIVEGGGAVLSPFGPEQPALPHQFLERNGIVAALADALLVVEAPARSGALNTASWAAGRIPVLAIPGDLDRPHVAGCHALIRDGAVLARSADDVLEALHLPPMLRELDRAPELPAPADPTARSLLSLLADGERDLDALIAGSGATPAATLAALTVLEIDGLVERLGAARYARRR